MLKMAGEVGVKWTGRLMIECVYAGGKGRRNVMCMTQESTGTSHYSAKYLLKLLERVLEARIMRRVEGDFGEEQQGFSKGRGTADGMNILRQMVEKRLEVQGSIALGFVDLEKAFDTVPREMVMATLQWMGVPEAEVRWLRACTGRQQQGWWWEMEHRRSLMSRLDSDRRAC